METVEFYSSPGVRLSADLYLPPDSAPRKGYPVVVACLGWGSVKELMESWAGALSGAGYATLVPDYRGFGSSGGIRGRCFPAEHVDDIRAALTYMGERGELNSDRMAVLGVSYGGAIAVATGGSDDRPRAVISVVGYGSGRRHLQAVRTDEQWTTFEARLAADRTGRVLRGQSEAVDSGEILLRDEEGQAWRRRMEEQYPHMAFRTTLESAQKIAEFQPEQSLPYPTPTPILFIHAEADSMIPVEESERMWNRAEEPKKLAVIPGAAHHDVHTGDAFRQVIGEVTEWLNDHVIAGPSHG